MNVTIKYDKSVCVYKDVKEVYELTPVTSQKSFNRKAKVITKRDGTQILQSYDTPMIKRLKSGRLVRLNDYWSATTGKHIYSFCGLRKDEFMKLPKR